MADNLIFISYSHKDSDFVKKAIAELESQNYNIWYDEGLEGGSAYNNEIAIQIKNCDCFIAFMSNNYAVSSYCTTELEYALKRQKDIFVAYIDDINEYDLPAGIEMHISRLQAVFRKDFSTDSDFITKICTEPIIEKYKPTNNSSQSVHQLAPNNTQAQTCSTEYEANDIRSGPFFYSGDIKAGMRHGKGKCTWERIGVYEGEWYNDKQYGKGKMIYHNGDVYEGEWKNGNFHGKGKMIYHNDDVYEGEWKNGNFHGKGKYIFANGDIYEGEWIDDRRNGNGKITYSNGDIFEGDWKNGQKDGRGKFTYSDGAVYDGDFIQNKRHGKGKFTFADGTVYDGKWKNGNRYGKGTIKYTNGDIYEGIYKNGKFHGKGTLTFPEDK